jgi:hypothetical protein
MARISIAEINQSEPTPPVAVSGYDNLSTVRKAVALNGKRHTADPGLVDEMVTNLDTLLAIGEAKKEAGIASPEMTHIIEADPDVTGQIGKIVLRSLADLGDASRAEQDAVVTASADFIANSQHLNPNQPPVELQHPRGKIGNPTQA